MLLATHRIVSFQLLPLNVSPVVNRNLGFQLQCCLRKNAITQWANAYIRHWAGSQLFYFTRLVMQKSTRVSMEVHACIATCCSYGVHMSSQKGTWVIILCNGTDSARIQSSFMWNNGQNMQHVLLCSYIATCKTQYCYVNAFLSYSEAST